MDIEEIIEKIVDNGRVEDMETLSDILEDLMELIERYAPDCYKEYEMQLYKMAFGNVLDKKMAEEIVNKMQPYGEKWSINETKRVQNEFGLHSISEVDFYTVLNAMYNDYNNIFGENTEMYVRLADDFINDEDAKRDKVFLYFTTLSE